MAVIEKVLNNPVLVTQADNEDYLTKHEKGWVCEIDKQIVRFSVVGLVTECLGFVHYAGI